MVQILKKYFAKLNGFATRNITGGMIGLTAALISVQRSGCSGSCGTCQNCAAAGIFLLTTPFVLKLQKRIRWAVFGLSLSVLIGVSVFL